MATNGNGNGNGRGAKWTAIAAIIVAVVGNLTVSFDARQARVANAHQNNQFFNSQCTRDEVRDKVFTDLLQKSKDAMLARPVPKKALEREARVQGIAILQSSIDQISLFEEWCRNSIPD